jgi:uncharacterized heparinase superfamily protein
MSALKTINRYSTTLYYLRKRQIAGQIGNKLNRLIEKPESFLVSSCIEPCKCKWRPKQDFLLPCQQGNSSSELLKGYFNFLNKRIFLGNPPDWNKEGLPKLWLYNLHYFDYLWLLDYTQSKNIVLDWIENYLLRKNTIGWDPYPVSLRLMNLCGVFFNKFLEQTENDESFLKKLWNSIYQQVEWLAKHIEVHLLGNHLFENAAALIFVGSCFDGDDAEGWYRKGKKILENEIHEQILPDGLHFERSGMYHVRITSLLANLLNINSLDLNDIVKQPLELMLEAASKVCHPDGDISLLNDSAFNIYNHPEQIIDYSKKLLGDISKGNYSNPEGIFCLQDAGYYGYRENNGTYIICDAAAIGPDYIPGHAHADILSFELSLKGHRVIVDSGVYDYEISEIRQYCRSTKAHNTIEINGQDQCEMWAAFRVARRGRPKVLEWKPSPDNFLLSAIHDGYKRLKGSPVHYRKFDWSREKGLSIQDKVTSSHTCNIKSRIHFHPCCEIFELKQKIAFVKYPGGKIKVDFSGEGNLTVEDSFYCPEFGVKIPNKSLVFTQAGSNIETGFHIEEM